MKEILLDVFNNDLAIEMGIILSIVIIFIIGGILSKLFSRLGLSSYNGVIKIFCETLSRKLSRKVNEKDPDYKNVNDELHRTLSNNQFNKEEKKDVNSN